MKNYKRKTYKQYKHKLNMLEPGSRMVIGIISLAGLSVFSYLMRAIVLCAVFGGISGALFIILFVLLMIEQHQDNVLNEQAIEETRKNGES